MAFQDDLKEILARDAAANVQRRSPSVPTAPSFQSKTPSPEFQAALTRVRSGDVDTSGGGGGGLGAPGLSLASKGFKGLIKGVDFARGAGVAAVKEGLDVLPEQAQGINWLKDDAGYRGDGSFDFDDWWRNTKQGIGFGDVIEEGFEDRVPLWMKQGAGLAGDIAFDPLTYVGVGIAAKGTKGGVKAAGAIDDALRHGSRTELPGAIARTRAATTTVKPAAQQVADQLAVDKLIRKSGTHGRAAFTRKSLKEAGVTDDMLAELGVKTRLGYSIGLGSSRVAIPGTQRLSELSETGKGAFKAWNSQHGPAKAFRTKFKSADKTFGEIEHAAKEAILSGSKTAPEAALALSNVKLAKMSAHAWADNQQKELSTHLRWLDKKTAKGVDGEELLHLVETAAGEGDEHAADLAKWFRDAGESLQRAGVDFDLISGNTYVSHVPTDDLLRLAKSGDEQVLAVFRALEGAPDASFVQARRLQEGTEWFGHTLTKDDLNIRRLNELSMEGAGIKAFIDDPAALVGRYIEQGRHQLLKDGLRSRNVSDRVIRDIGAEVDPEKLAAASYVDLRKATTLRKHALKTAAREAKKSRSAAGVELRRIDNEVAASAAKITGLESELNVLQGELGSFEVALDQWRRTQSRASQKGAATKKIKALEQQAAEAQEKLVLTQGKLARARKAETKAEWAAQRTQAQDAWDAADKAKKAAERVRDELDELPAAQVVRDAGGPSVPRQEAVEGIKATREQFLTKVDEVTDAANAHTWLTVDAATANRRLDMVADKLDEVIATADNAKSGRTRAEVTEANRMLREDISVAQRAYKATGEDAAYDLVRRMESQALAWDAANFRLQSAAKRRAGKTLSPGEQVLAAVNDDRFWDYMSQVIDDGFQKIDETLQAPDWFAAAKRRIDFADAAERKNLSKALKGYDAAMNTWKGWATTSPGFVFRNGYSGFFGMYLDGVNPVNVMKFQRYLKEYEGWLTSKGGKSEAGFAAADRWAKRKGYSEFERVRLRQALDAAAGSGWGLNAQEVTTKRVAGGFSANPLSPDFAPTKFIRDRSSDLEARMRGGHAYDVLMRGGDKVSALEHVERFHFNYRDISQFDRGAKRISPFWMFYSRNMALQAHVWTHNADKLNRSYFNLKRNLEFGTEDDQVTPGYFDELGAIKTPWGERDGGTKYFTPDLPSLRFRQDLAAITGTGEDGFDPLRILSDTVPAVKVPVELMSNRQLFTGIENKNRLYDYDEEGNLYPRAAPRLLQLPGVKNALNLLPGTEMINDQLLIQDNTQRAIEDFVPLLSRVNRLAPNTPKDQARQMDRWMSFIGAPVKTNTPQMIQGELYGRSQDVKEEARSERVIEMLRNLP